MAAQAPSLAAHVPLDLLDVVGSEVGEPAVLEVAPEQLDGVEVGGIRREPDDVPAWVCGQPGAHELVLVRIAPVPDEDDRAPHVTREVTEKSQDLRAANVQPG